MVETVSGEVETFLKNKDVSNVVKVDIQHVNLLLQNIKNIVDHEET